MGYYTLEEARKVADCAMDHIKVMCDKFIDIIEGDQVNQKVEELFNSVQYNIMKIAIEKEFEK